MENMNNQVNEGNNVQEKNKNSNKTIGFVLLVIGLLLLCFAGYKLFIESSNSGEPKPTDSPIIATPTPNNQEPEKYKAYDFDEVITNMKKNIYFEYAYTSEELPREIEVIPEFDKYVITLSSDGKVTIKKGDNEPIELSNISNAKNIECCNYVNATLYILLDNGDVYEYDLDNLDESKYNATKIDEIKNADKFVILDWADCTECGGNTNLGVIDKDNKYIELDGFSA